MAQRIAPILLRRTKEQAASDLPPKTELTETVETADGQRALYEGMTAADTVIHYDPWWNPAVEDQATDRAHRIGQDKPVFVHRLITAGSIKEKMEVLKGRKQALAAGILGASGGKALALSQGDIDLLFAPFGS